MPIKYNELEKKALMEQISMYHTELCSIQSGFITMISVSIGGYGLVLYYAIKSEMEGLQGIKALFLLLPFLFFLSFFNIIKHTTKMLGLGAYVRYLENQINTDCEKSIYQWYSYLIHANGYGWLGGLAQLPCFLVIGVYISLKFLESLFSVQSKVISVILMIMYIIQVLLIVVMLVQCLLQPLAVGAWSTEISEKYGDGKQYHTRDIDLKKCVEFYKNNYKRIDRDANEISREFDHINNEKETEKSP